MNMVLSSIREKLNSIIPQLALTYKRLFIFYRSFELEPVFFNLGVKRGPRQAEELGRLRAVASGDGQGFANQDAGKTIDAFFKEIFLRS